MTINSIELANYRQFKNLKIDFCDRKNIILGNGGVGKTTFCNAVKWILGMDEQIKYEFKYYESEGNLNIDVSRKMKQGETAVVRGAVTVLEDGIIYNYIMEEIYTKIDDGFDIEKRKEIKKIDSGVVLHCDEKQSNLHIQFINYDSYKPQRMFSMQNASGTLESFVKSYRDNETKKQIEALIGDVKRFVSSKIGRYDPPVISAALLEISKLEETLREKEETKIQNEVEAVRENFNYYVANYCEKGRQISVDDFSLLTYGTGDVLLYSFIMLLACRKYYSMDEVNSSSGTLIIDSPFMNLDNEKRMIIRNILDKISEQVIVVEHPCHIESILWDDCKLLELEKKRDSENVYLKECRGAYVDL